MQITQQLSARHSHKHRTTLAWLVSSSINNGDILQDITTHAPHSRVPQVSHTAQNKMLLTLMHIITPIQLCQGVLLSGHTELWTLLELSVSPSPSSAQPAQHNQNVAINILCRIIYTTWRCMLYVNMQLNLRSWFRNGSAWNTGWVHSNNSWSFNFSHLKLPPPPQILCYYHVVSRQKFTKRAYILRTEYFTYIHNLIIFQLPVFSTLHSKILLSHLFWYQNPDNG